MNDIKTMIRCAFEARERAYVRYSHFKVGACLEAADGRLFMGCNIENSSYSVTNCAERTAFFKAVSEGVYDFRRIVIVGGKEGTDCEFCPPCGVCLQVMMEFCKPEEFKVILAKSEDEYKEVLLKNLLPMGFGPDNL